MLPSRTILFFALISVGCSSPGNRDHVTPEAKRNEQPRIVRVYSTTDIEKLRKALGQTKFPVPLKTLRDMLPSDISPEMEEVSGLITINGKDYVTRGTSVYRLNKETFLEIWLKFLPPGKEELVLGAEITHANSLIKE